MPTTATTSRACDAQPPSTRSPRAGATTSASESMLLRSDVSLRAVRPWSPYGATRQRNRSLPTSCPQLTVPMVQVLAGREQLPVLFDPVELRLPPFDVGEAFVRAKALNVGRDGSLDRVDDPGSWRRPVRVAEDFDASSLFGCVGSVGSEVEPEKHTARVPGAALSKSIIATGFPDRKTKLQGERSL